MAARAVLEAGPGRLLVCYITLAPFFMRRRLKVLETALTCTESRQRRSMHAFRLARIGARAATRLCSHGQLPAALVGSTASSTAACSAAAVVAVAAGATAAACDLDESPRDAYGGITVVVRETDNFEATLTASLDRWRRDGVRGVWLEVPAALVKYLPSILDHGFTLRGGDATHVLCCAWLPGGESPLPPGPTHQVGVGAVVTDRVGRLLLVQEAVGPAQGRWKLPTGLCESNEDVGQAAAREVREETGLEVRPAEVLAVRHSHGFHRGVSDVFFCVRCEAIDEGAVLTPQAGEIARVAWRPVSDAHDAATPAWQRIYQIAARGGGLRADTYPGRGGATATCIYSSG